MVAAFCGWCLGLSLAELLFYNETTEQWSRGSWAANGVLSIVGAAVCGLSILLLFKLFELLLFILGNKERFSKK